MPTDPWIDTAGWHDQAPPPVAAPAARTTQRAGTVLVCPHCGSPQIRQKDNTPTTQSHRWECRACSGEAWRLPATLPIARAYIVE